MLTRYWIKFERNPGYSGLQEVFGLGAGVTAYDLNDAKALLLQKMFKNGVPEIKSVIENVKFEELDAGHVQPNMGTIVRRGIWFPLGFE